MVDHAAFDERQRKAGYFFIVSDREMTCQEMLAFYRHRDVIEKDFMHAKSQEDLHKTYAQSDGCYEEKTFMGFLCPIYSKIIFHFRKIMSTAFYPSQRYQGLNVKYWENKSKVQDL